METTVYGYLGAAGLVVGFIIFVIYTCKKYYESLQLLDEAEPLV